MYVQADTRNDNTEWTPDM